VKPISVSSHPVESGAIGKAVGPFVGALAAAVAAAAVDAFGRLDAVVSNAGIFHTAAFEDLAADEWRRMLDVHLSGLANVAAIEGTPHGILANCVLVRLLAHGDRDGGGPRAAG
jgi:NAD(P)-dependent dehydrogenase (short-subunit alcohol dehydrogenase family)